MDKTEDGTRVVLSTAKYMNVVVTLDAPYEAIAEKADAEIIRTVENAIGDKIDVDAVCLRVTRAYHWRTLYVMPKPVWGANGAAQQIQSKHGLSDDVTEDIAKTLQAFYEMGAEIEKQRQEELRQEEQRDALCQCKNPLLYYCKPDDEFELWCCHCRRPSSVELK